MANTTSWTVVVTPETDISVRAYLAQGGIKRRALSQFVEESVKWRLLDLTLAVAATSFSDLSSDEMDALIDRCHRRGLDRRAGIPRSLVHARGAARRFHLPSPQGAHSLW